MGWLLGVISLSNERHLNVSKVIDEPEVKTHSFSNLQLIYGGKNIIFDLSSSLQGIDGWIASGIAFKTGKQSKSFCKNEEWENFLEHPGKINYDGHFILVSLNNEYVNIYSDLTGLRDVYILKDNDKIFFSTRIDLLLKIKPLEIDYSVFGSRWLLVNQLTDKSIFNNVLRIVKGKQANIDLQTGNIEVKSNEWFPEVSNELISIKEFNNLLNKSIAFSDADNRKISLALSGGLDSRVLLSSLLANNEINWNAHTFGGGASPDSMIAKSISNKIPFDHKFISDDSYSVDLLLSKMKEYVSQTNLNESVSLVPFLMNASNHYNKDIIIDGGFGEVWRREFLNKLLWYGKSDLLKRNYANIVSHLKIDRASIFNDDINNEMLNGCIQQVEEMFNLLPDMEKTGIENWLDLFAIKTRLVNYYSPEQSRLDNETICFMPFAQLFLLDKLFTIPVSLRKNGKLFKKIINENYPVLAGIKLAKGKTIQPFGLGSLQSRILNRIKTKTGFGVYNDESKIKLFISLKEVVNDLYLSKDVNQSSVYDLKKVKPIVEGFYKGNNSMVDQLDWWFSFELLRQKTASKII